MRQFTQIRFLLKLAALAIVSDGALAITTTTVSFQNDVDGYMGTFDRKISPNAAAELNGSSVLAYSIAGGATTNDQALIQFDNIFGNEVGQVPAGAFILDAKLQLATASAGGSQTTGPYGVAGLLEPVDSSTTYSAYGSRGAWWQDGHATRPMGGYGTMSIGTSAEANVRPIVQQWSSGTLANNGLVVQAGFPGTTDNWTINSTGHPVPTLRPKLSVTYTTAVVEVNTFQHGLNGYTDDPMIWMHSSGGFPPIDITVDGLDSDYFVLHGTWPSSTIVSLAMMKFNNLFGTTERQVPNEQPVVKAWLVLTTDHQQDIARTAGPFSAHAVLRPWDIDSEYSNFGPNDGVTVADGDIGPALDTQRGMIAGSEIWLDVTSYVEGVRNGSTDYGLAIIPGTDDDWLIHSNGSSLPSARPRLVIVSEPSEPTGVPGDYNGDGIVNAADYAVWRDNKGSTFNLAGNGDETLGSAGVVDGADYQYWRANFGAPAGNGTAIAVPEPGNIPIILLLITAFILILPRPPRGIDNASICN